MIDLKMLFKYVIKKFAKRNTSIMHIINKIKSMFNYYTC